MDVTKSWGIEIVFYFPRFSKLFYTALPLSILALTWRLLHITSRKINALYGFILSNSNKIYKFDSNMKKLYKKSVYLPFLV